MAKIKLTAEQKKVLADKMREAKNYSDADREVFMARTIGDVYDVELPIPEVVDSLANFQRAGVGEHLYYLAPETDTKSVRTISANCNLTETKVTPSSRTEVSWTDLVSDKIYVCLHDWIQGDHDVLTFNADMIQEAMDRQEIYTTLALVGAGATSESNTYTLRSGETKFVFPDLVDMARSVAKYGRNLVLVTGGNVTTDIQLLNYDADKNQAVSIFDVVDKHIPIEELSVTIDGSATDVLSADVAYLVAVSDAKKNRPLLVARRQTSELAASFDTEMAPASKERIVISTGNEINIGSNSKLAKGFIGYEEYSATSLNDKCYASFTRS